MKKRNFGFVAAVLSICLLLGACGGGGTPAQSNPLHQGNIDLPSEQPNNDISVEDAVGTYIYFLDEFPEDMDTESDDWYSAFIVRGDGTVSFVYQGTSQVEGTYEITGNEIHMYFSGMDMEENILIFDGSRFYLSFPDAPDAKIPMLKTTSVDGVSIISTKSAYIEKTDGTSYLAAIIIGIYNDSDQPLDALELSVPMFDKFGDPLFSGEAIQRDDFHTPGILDPYSSDTTNPFVENSDLETIPAHGIGEVRVIVMDNIVKGDYTLPPATIIRTVFS